MSHEQQAPQRTDLRAHAAQAERLHHFSHGLKNRLAGMMEVSRMLGTTGDPAQEAELRTFFEDQFFKALREVEGLLDDMAVDRGVGRLALAPTPLAPLVEEAVKDARHRADRKQQTITLEGLTQVSVQADPHYLLQALQALLSNASKFGHAGSAIEVQVVPAGERSRITVRDAGVGLTTEDLEQVFQRYAMLSSKSTAGEAQGRSTLARARQWLQAMGGDLTASSEGKDKGAAFTIELPLA